MNEGVEEKICKFLMNFIAMYIHNRNFCFKLAYFCINKVINFKCFSFFSLKIIFDGTKGEPVKGVFTEISCIGRRWWLIIINFVVEVFLCCFINFSLIFLINFYVFNFFKRKKHVEYEVTKPWWKFLRKISKY